MESEGAIGKLDMENRILYLTAICVAFALLLSGGLFVTAIFWAPKALASIPSGLASSGPVMIATLGIFGGVAAAVPFGLSFGLLSFGSLRSSILTSIGAVLVLNLYRWIAYSGGDSSRTSLLASIALVEAVALVSVFTATTKLTKDRTASLQPKIRIIYGAVALIVTLLIFNRIFSIYLPGFFGWI